MYCMYIAKLMSGREDFSLYSRDSQRDTEKATFFSKWCYFNIKCSLKRRSAMIHFYNLKATPRNQLCIFGYYATLKG